MEPVRLGATMLPDIDIGSGSLRFAMDYLTFDYHGDTYSHIDALCHVAFEGWLYNGHPAAGITSQGAAVHGIEAYGTASSAAACCSTSPGCGVPPGWSPVSTCSARSSWRHRPRRGAVVVGEVHQVHGLFRVVGQDAGQ
jgi:hypothetical protein